MRFLKAACTDLLSPGLAFTDYRIASAATFLPSTWKVCSQSLPGMLQYPPKINTGRAAAAFQAMAHGVQFGIVG
jgi:hypothetical protein